MQALKQKQIERPEVDSRLSVNPASQVVEADALHDTLHEVADSFDVEGFKCAKCGLVHGHDTMKHRLSDTFDISEDEVSDMEYNSVCHCGLQEAARHGDDFGVDESDASRMAGNAPIPSETAVEMDEEFGTA